MGSTTIYDPNSSTRYSIYHVDDFEYVTPIEKMEQIIKESHFRILRDFIALKSPITEDVVRRIIVPEVEKDWRKYYEKINNTKIPRQLLLLLTLTKKKDQVRCLKGLSIRAEQLLAFFFYAWKKHRFTYSQYSCEHLPNITDKTDLPQVFEVRKDDVEIIGETKLTKGQLKQTVDHRHALVAKFLDRGDVWHCFFTTFKSIGGRENWKGGQPHYHYISSGFGLSRKEVVDSLQSPEYGLGSLPHVDLLRYPGRNEESRD